MPPNRSKGPDRACCVPGTGLGARYTTVIDMILVSMSLPTWDKLHVIKMNLPQHRSASWSSSARCSYWGEMKENSQGRLPGLRTHVANCIVTTEDAEGAKKGEHWILGWHIYLAWLLVWKWGAGARGRWRIVWVRAENPTEDVREMETSLANFALLF